MRWFMLLAIHFLTMSVFMGIGITAVLAVGMPGSQPILLAAVAGFVLAIPVTWLVTRQILARTSVQG